MECVAADAVSGDGGRGVDKQIPRLCLGMTRETGRLCPDGALREGYPMHPLRMGDCQ